MPNDSLYFIIVSSVSTTTPSQFERTFQECAPEVEALYARCAESAPNYGIPYEEFAEAVVTGANKYLLRGGGSQPPVSAAELRQFIAEIQASDLYLALACARGNEHAWWDFDSGYRRFIERVAQHLASAGTDAEEVMDSVYTELYGTRVVDGVRHSKFATYTGRGTLRGWLRTIVWHAVVDMHRARRDAITIEDWSESGGETDDRPGWRAEAYGGESAMVNRVARERYGAATVAALDAALASLDEHEKLLLLYYHVEGLKLREIARLVEEPLSPLRRWFQRQAKKSAGDAQTKSRVYESTVMRWLEKVYAQVHRRFAEELEQKSGLSEEEIMLCVEMAGGGIAPEDLYRHLKIT